MDEHLLFAATTVGVRGGQVDILDILLEWRQVGGSYVLTVYSEWRPRVRAWGQVRTYQVHLRTTDLVGWAFQLDREAEAVASDGIDHYSCFVSQTAEPDLCDCLGNLSRGYCIHTQALRALIDRGCIVEE